MFCSVQVGSPDTDSSMGVLSPVPGTGFWEPDITEITLHKGEEGLGFSILDFAVSWILRGPPLGFHVNFSPFQGPSPGGGADHSSTISGRRGCGRARRTSPCRRQTHLSQRSLSQECYFAGTLLSHMTISLKSHDQPVSSYSPLQFAVQQLVNIPQGTMVELTIHHPVLAESDLSDCSSFSPLPSPPHDFRDLTTSNDHQFFRSGEGRRRSSSLSGLDDLGHSGGVGEERLRGRHSSEEGEGEREGRREGREEDGYERGEGKWKVRKKSSEDGESERKRGRVKPKKALESEDDEPPPPYSKTDPHEKKSKQGSGENIPPTDPPRPPSSGANVKTDSDRRESISPLQLSRISSPSRGLSLSELTRVTPEDQERWRQSRENLEREKSLESLTEIHSRCSPIQDASFECPAREWPRAEKPVEDGQFTPLESSSPHRSVSGYDQSQMESYSDTTLVGSQSQSDTGNEDKREAEKTKTHPQMRLKTIENKKKTRRSPKGSRSPKHPPPEALSNDKSKSSKLAVTYTHVSHHILSLVSGCASFIGQWSVLSSPRSLIPVPRTVCRTACLPI